LKGLPALLQSIAAAGVARSGVTAAATVLLMIPPVLIFILSQNNVIETMSTSGLK
jgi:ABC-type glycerol-3-phosphate transport system permease component